MKPSAPDASKAAGQGEICPLFIKSMTDILKALTRLFNTSLDECKLLGNYLGSVAIPVY